MKNRILSNWSAQRAFYLILGAFMVFEGIIEKQWFGIAFGGYFAAMGLFAFGCAGGNCYGFNNNSGPSPRAIQATEDVEFEEIKSK